MIYFYQEKPTIGQIMPLTNDEAEILYNSIINVADWDVKIQKANQTWSSLFTAAATISPQESYQNIQSHLIKLRKASLDRKSLEMAILGKPVRVFTSEDGSNIHADLNDIFARGIDTARAAIEILSCTSPQNSNDQIFNTLGMSDKAKTEFIALFIKFHENMRHHTAQELNNKNVKNAKKELRGFNSALSSLLVEHNLILNRENANHALNLVRDFLWKKDICTANCVIQTRDNSTMLRYADPATFGPAEFTRIDKKNPRTTVAPLDYWQLNQHWLKKLFKSVGSNQDYPWLHYFIKKHSKLLRSQSSTPMSRYTPNPANAFDCTDIIIQNDQVVSKSHHLRMAITEPISVGDTKSSQELTNWNHLQLLNKKRIASEINLFLEKWGDLFPNNEPLPLTILHQTLIGDEVAFSPDQKKAKESILDASVINSKLKANDAARRFLNRYIVAYDKSKKTVHFLNRDYFAVNYPNGLPINYQEIRINLLETNVCINMWHSRARVRNNDINHSRQLISYAVDLFQLVAAANNNPDLTTIIDFLNSANHSFFIPYKFRGNSVKQALARLTNQLKATDASFSPFNDLSTQENFAFSLRAAVELKCTIHETWAHSIRRNISNFSRDYFRKIPLVGHLVDWFVRGTMAIVASVLKVITGIFYLPLIINHFNDRQEIHKASYEGLLAESLGALQGGCMSSVDRATEMAEQRAAMKIQFAETGELISYNDNSLEKEKFYREYGSTLAKHHFVEMATGTSGTSDLETRGIHKVGLMSEVTETRDEKKLSKNLLDLREGQYDSSINMNKYLTIKPVGSKQSAPSFVSLLESLTTSKNTEHSHEPEDDRFIPLLDDDSNESSIELRGIF